MRGMFGSRLGWKVLWLLLATRVVKFRFVSLHMYGAKRYYLTADTNLISEEKGKTYPLQPFTSKIVSHNLLLCPSELNMQFMLYPQNSNL